MENGLMNSHMMGFTDVRGLNILEDAISKFPDENYRNIDIQKSLDQYDLFRKEANFDEIYGDSDRTMDLGDNCMGSLLTRGMAEIVRVGLKLGGKIETFLGLTGMGDLIVTCTSVHSRNRKAGYLIGTGKTMEEAVEETGMVVEGIKACKAFYELKEELGIEMPITDALYQVLFNGKNAKEMVNMLLQRDKKSETY